MVFFLLALYYISFVESSPDCRPNITDRAFTSTIINGVVSNVSSMLKDQNISKIFHCTYPNTLDSTVNYTFNPLKDDLDTFIITGDIDGMWLRDSTWQVNGYLRYVKELNDSTYNENDQHLYNMLYGLHNRHMNSILIDVYANAFNYNNNSFNGSGGPHQSDYRIPPMNTKIFEGKYELDSLCSVLHFTYKLYMKSKDQDLISSKKWKQVVNKIYHAMKYQQLSTSTESFADDLYYAFARSSSIPTDTLIHKIGPPALYNGLIKSAFRPSDDATRLPFNIASNGFAVVTLKQNAILFRDVLHDYEMHNKLTILAEDIDSAIKMYGILNDNSYAYEIDGYGSHYFMDDGNVPSLLSLPYLEYLNKTDVVYLNTRKHLLSQRSNPYFFKGNYTGIGSPHTGYGNIWPMSIIIQAMTSDNDTEITYCLNQLKNSTDDTWFMHESFDQYNPSIYTRSWFAWCNNLFGDLILQLIEERPWLVV